MSEDDKELAASLVQPDQSDPNAWLLPNVMDHTAVADAWTRYLAEKGLSGVEPYCYLVRILDTEYKVRQLEEQIKNMPGPGKNVSLPYNARYAVVSEEDVWGEHGQIVPPNEVPPGDYVLIHKDTFLKVAYRAGQTMPQPVPLVPPKAPEGLSMPAPEGLPVEPPTFTLVNPDFINKPEPERIRLEGGQSFSGGCVYDECRKSDSPYCQVPGDCRGDKPKDQRVVVELDAQVEPINPDYRPEDSRFPEMTRMAEKTKQEQASRAAQALAALCCSVYVKVGLVLLMLSVPLLGADPQTSVDPNEWVSVYELVVIEVDGRLVSQHRLRKGLSWVRVDDRGNASYSIKDYDPWNAEMLRKGYRMFSPKPVKPAR